jgi:hypothetical protein
MPVWRPFTELDPRYGSGFTHTQFFISSLVTEWTVRFSRDGSQEDNYRFPTH